MDKLMAKKKQSPEHQKLAAELVSTIRDAANWFALTDSDYFLECKLEVYEKHNLTTDISKDDWYKYLFAAANLLADLNYLEYDLHHAEIRRGISPADHIDAIKFEIRKVKANLKRIHKENISLKKQFSKFLTKFHDYALLAAIVQGYISPSEDNAKKQKIKLIRDNFSIEPQRIDWNHNDRRIVAVVKWQGNYFKMSRFSYTKNFFIKHHDKLNIEECEIIDFENVAVVTPKIKKIAVW